MKPEHFFYWLQGYFELSGTHDPLTDKQSACILSHIELVEASGPTSNILVIEIRTLLSMLETSREMVTAEVRKRISDEFIHVIDDAHIYNKHVDQVEEQLNRVYALTSPILALPRGKDIFSYTFEDFEISNYAPLGPIKAPVAV